MSKSHKSIFKIILTSGIIGCMGLSSVFAAELKLRSSINTAPSEIQLKGGVKIDKHSQTISLSIRDTDVRQVLRMLADKAGFNIVLHDSVQGKVTLDLNRTPLNKAFEYVMTVNKLAYWQDGNTIVVATSDEAANLGLNKSLVKPIKIKYANAGAVANFLNKSIFNINRPNGSSKPSIVINPDTNDIIVFGSDQDVALAQKVVKFLDVKPEVRTYEINYAQTGDIANVICSSVFGNKGAATALATGTNAADENSLACSDDTDPTAGPSAVTADVMESFKTKGYQVFYNDSLRRITVFGGTQEQISRVEDTIKRFDKKQQQVLIELSIIELSESGSKALSSTWSYQDGKLGIDGGYYATSRGTTWDGTSGTGLNQTGDVLDSNGQTATAVLLPGGYMWRGNRPSVMNYKVLNPDWAPITDPITGEIRNISSKYIYINGGSDLVPSFAHTIAQQLTTLITQNKGRLLANPRIIATNNQQSTIDITSEYLDNKTETQNVAATTGTTRTITYTKGSAGIKIDITPKISPNGYINLDLNPSYTQPAEQLGAGTEIILTYVNARKLDLKNIRVKDGESVVIGGLMQDRETNVQQKIPLLAEIPVLGMFFKTSSTQKQRSELIIMVTPKIIKDKDSDTDTL